MHNQKNSNYIINAWFSSSFGEQTHIKTKCKYSYSPDLINIFYQEDSDNNKEYIDTNIKIYNKNKFIIVREQKLKNQDKNIYLNTSPATTSNIIIIQKNNRNSLDYNTPYGKLIMGTTGQTIQINLSSEGGSFFISYDIDFNNQKSHTNTISAQILKK